MAHPIPLSLICPPYSVSRRVCRVAGRPNLSIPQTDILNAGRFISGIHAELIMGRWEAYWTGSFKITAPVAGSGEGEITQDLTTFTGQAQIVT